MARSDALLTRSPLATRLPRAAVRLACVRHAASVQSEPGSNSSVQSNLTRNSLTIDFSTSMDLSIRVTAFNTCATNVAPHQGTHTYRLSKFLKINTATPKKQRQQQRSGIIQYPTKTVKKKFPTRPKLPSPGARGQACPPQRRCALYRSGAGGQYAVKKYSPTCPTRPIFR